MAVHRILILYILTYREIEFHLQKKCKEAVVDITVKILKFGTPQTIAIIVLKIEKFDVTLH